MILPDFPASVQGQQDFVKALRTVVSGSEKGLGFCYWGAELVVWKGAEGENASPWENQALPVLEGFKE